MDFGDLLHTPAPAVAIGSRATRIRTRLGRPESSYSLKNSTRAKHALRRYHVLQQRIKEGDVELHWIPDEHNPADFLTKFCGGSKYEQSKRFATGIHAKEAIHAAVKGWRKPRR